jgi:hypothetical protein
VTGVAWHWTSSNPSVAAVDLSSGLVAAVAVGQATITATSGTSSARATIRVLSSARVTVTPGGILLSGQGSSQTLSAQYLDAQGAAVAGKTFSWASLNPAVATVDGAGVVRAVAAGQATIAATADNATGYALATVSTPETAPFRSWVRDSSGTTANLYDVWSASPSSAFAVGASGTILRWNGTTWTPMASGTTRELRGVWGTSGTDVFAVGDNVALHWDGTAWSPMMTPSVTLIRLWGTSPTDVVAVGGSNILRWNGGVWVPVTGLPAEYLQTVWGTSASDVFVGGANSNWSSSVLLRSVGTSWTQTTVTGLSSVYGIWGTSPTDMWVVGDGQNPVKRWNGSNWLGSQTPIDVSAGVTPGLVGIGGTSMSNLYAVGTSGGANQSSAILRWDGSSWTVMTSGTTAILRSIAPTATFIVGDGGLILRGVR